MTNEQSFISAGPFDQDLYTSSRTLERTLNAAIAQADLCQSFEEYLDVFDEFYADDLEVGSETEEEPIRGKGRVRSLLTTFLIPLYVMAEIGGLLISVRRQRCREMLQTRRILPGHSTWSGCPAEPAL